MRHPLRATCKLNRSSTSFDNTVRFGHGGTKGDYEYLEFTIVGEDENVFAVEGRGSRSEDDTVDFRLGVNNGISGQFDDGKTVTLPAGGPWRSVGPVYVDEDMYGKTQYDVRFDGSVRADGPTGYVIDGELSAFGGAAALTTQYARLGHKGAGGFLAPRGRRLRGHPEEDQDQGQPRQRQGRSGEGGRHQRGGQPLRLRRGDHPLVA
ncbi:hypothetical protein [Streptomyces sp. TS71-3]|uniref:hypothetical protein n=1 Tax=Streptomyces sp. TS71-3 TaxID=2733862 RepID=UPI001B106CD0|nr:hypothetical protein [Streptomyces sp. TS71-3]GHJ39483.1 hypothetical protein Sm713_50920 [Streptomyces sp. TS71-3]